MKQQENSVGPAASPRSEKSAGRGTSNWRAGALKPGATELREKVNMETRVRILRNAHRQMFNLIKLERYGEAAYRSQVLAGILRTWDAQAEKSRVQ